MSTNILIVEDQEDIGALIAVNLESLNFATRHLTNGRDGFELARREHFDLIILDIMLPGMNGLDICQQLRQLNNFCPILMLTAKKSEADRVVGLEVGADDYLTKPFSVRELQARVKAMLRRVSFNESQGQDEDDDVRYFGDLSIDLQKRSVGLKGESIKLTAKEFDLLFYMANHPGKVFTREQLLNAVWGHRHDGYEHTVNSHINRLRAKLESGVGEPKYVLTVWGVGYKFYDC